MTQTWLAIINPYAGHRRSQRQRNALAIRLSAELNAEVVFTQYHGHAKELAGEASAYAGLAVFGGDGTTAEVVNGMDLDKQSLLLLAGGTGNGLARDLGLTTLESSFTAAHTGHTQALDLIRVSFTSSGQTHQVMVISTASIGYAAEVVVIGNQFFKALGPLCYPAASFIQAVRQSSFKVSVSLPSNSPNTQHLSNIMINNTRHSGNFSAFRRADLNDGTMTVLLAKAGFVPQILHNLAVLTKTYFYTTAKEITTQSINLALPIPQRLMIDGEIWDDIAQIQFDALPGKLNCFVNK